MSEGLFRSTLPVIVLQIVLLSRAENDKGSRPGPAVFRVCLDIPAGGLVPLMTSHVTGPGDWAGRVQGVSGHPGRWTGPADDVPCHRAM